MAVGKNYHTLSQEELYLRFSDMQQAPVKLELALEAIFRQEDMPESWRQAYLDYLKHRVRAAAEVLIQAEDTEHLAWMLELGWFSSVILDELLLAARQQHKMASLAWLLKAKSEVFGYIPKTYTL